MSDIPIGQDTSIAENEKIFSIMLAEAAMGALPLAIRAKVDKSYPEQEKLLHAVGISIPLLIIEGTLEADTFSSAGFALDGTFGPRESQTFNPALNAEIRTGEPVRLKDIEFQKIELAVVGGLIARDQINYAMDIKTKLKEIFDNLSFLEYYHQGITNLKGEIIDVSNNTKAEIDFGPLDDFGQRVSQLAGTAVQVSSHITEETVPRPTGIYIRVEKLDGQDFECNENDKAWLIAAIQLQCEIIKGLVFVIDKKEIPLPIIPYTAEELFNRAS